MGVPAFTPRRRPAPTGTAHAAFADRVHAHLLGYGDVGTTKPAIAADLKRTQHAVEMALVALRAAGRAERTPAGTWLATAAACRP
jgi:hypothetical protein